MSLILLISVLIRLLAMGWALRLWQQVRDWRIGFLGAMVALMALRQGLTLSRKGLIWPPELTANLDELPGLAVSVLALLAIIFLGRMIAEERQKTLELSAANRELEQEIERRLDAENQVDYLAHHDKLTRLPNRALLMERLNQTLALRDRQGPHSVLLLINIDRFKNINDARGHDMGDRLLCTVADRLGGVLRANATLARLASDEFAMLVPELGQQPEQTSHRALSLAEQVLCTMRAPLVIGREEIYVTASLGLTTFPETREDDSVAVLRRANTALHRAKEAGGNRSTFFETDMSDSAEQRFQIERELRSAVSGNELRLYIQPQVNAQGEMLGAEALVRWLHPERGMIPPGVFIPIAEESDLILDVGGWVLAETLKLMARGDMGGTPFRLSVNLSPRQFRQPGFVAWLKNLLATTGADPNHLTLEVTEGLVIDNIHEVIARMSEIAELGVHFSIDDFGTGYSSLSYLKRLPVHELKIDRSFIQDAPHDESDAALVETILAVAHHMHLRVVAEGVETREQAEFLNRRADVLHQGYLYAKPMPASEWYERWVSTRPTAGDAD